MIAGHLFINRSLWDMKMTDMEHKTRYNFTYWPVTYLIIVLFADPN